MQETKDILQMQLAGGPRICQLAQVAGCGKRAVSVYLRRSQVIGPTDWATIPVELARRDVQVTLALPWQMGWASRTRLPAQRLLRALSTLGTAVEALDAPAALCRREAPSRLGRMVGTDLRRARPVALPRAAVRQRPWCERLSIRGRDSNSAAAGLAGEPSWGAQILSGGPDDPGVGQDSPMIETNLTLPQKTQQKQWRLRHKSRFLI